MNNVQVMVKNNKCTGCTIRIGICPYGFISVTDGELGFPVPHIENGLVRQLG